MKKILFLTMLFPAICLSQNWENATNFPFEGIHHPVTFSYGDELLLLPEVIQTMFTNITLLVIAGFN